MLKKVIFYIGFLVMMRDQGYASLCNHEDKQKPIRRQTFSEFGRAYQEQRYIQTQEDEKDCYKVSYRSYTNESLFTVVHYKDNRPCRVEINHEIVDNIDAGGLLYASNFIDLIKQQNETSERIKTDYFNECIDRIEKKVHYFVGQLKVAGSKKHSSILETWKLLYTVSQINKYIQQLGRQFSLKNVRKLRFIDQSHYKPE